MYLGSKWASLLKFLSATITVQLTEGVFLLEDLLSFVFECSGSPWHSTKRQSSFRYSWRNLLFNNVGHLCLVKPSLLVLLYKTMYQQFCVSDTFGLCYIDITAARWPWSVARPASSNSLARSASSTFAFLFAVLTFCSFFLLR